MVSDHSYIKQYALVLDRMSGEIGRTMVAWDKLNKGTREEVAVIVLDERLILIWPSVRYLTVITEIIT